MSGIDIVYDGKRLIKEQVKQQSKAPYSRINTEKNSIFLETRYSFKFKPSLKINTIVPNSPADKAGLKVNDVLLSLNNKPIYEYKLEEIIYKLREKENKKIKLKVLREGKELNFKFLLEKKI
jgi:C-terminal processing protease CtpA/Prc